MKPVKSILVIVFVTLSVCAGSQIPSSPPSPPPPPVSSGSKADSLRNEGNITDAITEYRKMAEAAPGEYLAVYNYASALSIGLQADSAFKYLHIAIKLNPSVAPLADPDFFYIRNDKRWQEFENKLMSALSSMPDYNIRDIEYARKLLRLLCMDQYGFYETMIAVKNLGPASPVVSSLRVFQDTIRGKNLRELEALLKDKGWPKTSEVGRQASVAAFYVLQHSNGVSQQKYISMFEQCCRENEGNWRQYALMFDRMRMNLNQPQRFGTHYYMDNRYPGENVLYPLEDENKVDEWRKEIGLEPLKDYMISIGMKKEPSVK